MQSKTLFELDAISSVIIRSMQRSVDSAFGLPIDCSNITQTKEGKKVIEGIIQRYLTFYSDEMDSNFRRVLDDINRLEHLAQAKNLGYENEADYANSRLLVFEDPDIRDLYHSLILVITGSTFSVKCAIERYLETLIPKAILDGWVDSMDELTESIMDDILLCDDPWWNENLLASTDFTGWTILDVSVENDTVIIYNHGDYRVTCWTFENRLSRKRDRVAPEPVRRKKKNKLENLAFFNLLTEDAKYHLNRQMLLDVQNKIEFNIERLGNVASYDATIPYNVRAILANFFANNNKMPNVNVDPIKVTAGWNKEQERLRRAHVVDTVEELECHNAMRE